MPRLKEHKQVALSPDRLEMLTGRYALSPEVMLSVAPENGHLYLQENDESRQELLPESPLDFYSANSSDECSFKLSNDGVAQSLVLHLEGKDLELKRVQ